MRTSQAGIDLIKRFEGFRADRYRDPVGIWTIGYGTTEAVVKPLPMTVTQAQAEDLLRRSLQRQYEPAINNLGVPLNQQQFDALASFVYNLGPGAVGPGWTMGQRLRARDYRGASAAFMLYVKAGGQTLQGLVNRRRAERDLFDTPVKDASAPAAAQPPVEDEDGTPSVWADPFGAWMG